MVLALADMLLAKCLLLYKYNELCIGGNGAFLAWAFLPINLAPIGRARASGLPQGNGAGRDPRNPAKRDKLPSVAFYPASFLAKTCQVFLLTNDAPSMALLVLPDKMPRFWPDTECRTQLKDKIRSRRMANC
jgi:hypothetical protein